MPSLSADINTISASADLQNFFGQTSSTTRGNGFALHEAGHASASNDTPDTYAFNVSEEASVHDALRGQPPHPSIAIFDSQVNLDSLEHHGLQRELNMLKSMISTVPKASSDTYELCDGSVAYHNDDYLVQAWTDQQKQQVAPAGSWRVLLTKQDSHQGHLEPVEKKDILRFDQVIQSTPERASGLEPSSGSSIADVFIEPADQALTEGSWAVSDAVYRPADPHQPPGHCQVFDLMPGNDGSSPAEGDVMQSYPAEMASQLHGSAVGDHLLAARGVLSAIKNSMQGAGAEGMAQWRTEDALVTAYAGNDVETGWRVAMKSKETGSELKRSSR